MSADAEPPPRHDPRDLAVVPYNVVSTDDLSDAQARMDAALAAPGARTVVPLRRAGSMRALSMNCPRTPAHAVALGVTRAASTAMDVADFGT